MVYKHFSPFADNSLGEVLEIFLQNIKKTVSCDAGTVLEEGERKRLDDLLIQREMFSAQAAFNVFMTFISAGFVILVLNPYSGVSGKSIAYGIIISVPIMISEIFWLSKDGRVQDLIARRKRWLKGKKQAR